MRSLTTTTVPSGTIQDWCVQSLIDIFTNSPQECANATLGTQPSDYATICCAGDIRDTTQDLWEWPRTRNKTYVDLENLICCRTSGPQRGGIGPIDSNRMHCSQGQPMPLASFAATDTDNAALYPVTYTSAYGYQDSTTTCVGDFVPTETPTCLWAYTKTGVAMRNVTVPAAEISTMPVPTTDQFGFTITSVNSDTRFSATPALTSDAVSSPSATSAAARGSSGTATVMLALVLVAGIRDWKKP